MSGPVREGSHLLARFFDVLLAKPLRPSEQREVALALRSDAERHMFWEQSTADQRHGLSAARHVRSHPDGRPDLVRAALLHDVGKRHAHLGTVGRVIASLLRVLRMSGNERIKRYLEHGALAADELHRAQAEEIVVDYARFHHGSRPTSITIDDWALLDAADRVAR